MSLKEEDQDFKHKLLVVCEVSVYKIPPRATSGGYKCGNEWLHSGKIRSGRIREVSRKDRCKNRLEDPNSGDLFDARFVFRGQCEGSVEPVLERSRYFVLKIEMYCGDTSGNNAASV